MGWCRRRRGGPAGAVVLGEPELLRVLLANISVDNISADDIVCAMETTQPSQDLPPISRTAFHVLVAIGPEERHGYAIMQEVARITNGATRLGPGGVYTTIRRLLDDGLIEESDERPDGEVDDQRRRYYRLTGLGRAVVAAEIARLDSLVEAARPWALEFQA